MIGKEKRVDRLHDARPKASAERLERKLARLRDETAHPPLDWKPKARTTAVRFDYSLRQR